MRYQIDYILGTDCCLFKNVAVWDPQYDSDHYMVLVYLCSAHLREHTDYFGRHTQLPPQFPTTLTKDDVLFMALMRAIPKTKDREASMKAWILVDTWRIVNERFSACHCLTRNQSLIQCLGRMINASLKGYNRRHM